MAATRATPAWPARSRVGRRRDPANPGQEMGRLHIPTRVDFYSQAYIHTYVHARPAAQCCRVQKSWEQASVLVAGLGLAQILGFAEVRRLGRPARMRHGSSFSRRRLLPMAARKSNPQTRLSTLSSHESPPLVCVCVCGLRRKSSPARLLAWAPRKPR